MLEWRESLAAGNCQCESDPRKSLVLAAANLPGCRHGRGCSTSHRSRSDRSGPARLRLVRDGDGSCGRSQRDSSRSRGEVDYLTVCPPSGLPVAVGGVDYTKPPGAATIWQLSVQAELRSCGIGTVLIEALEQRARVRGLRWIELGVDDNRSRPRGLYERLGYVVSGSELGSWDEEALDGTVTRYETRITLLRKQLT